MSAGLLRAVGSLRRALPSVTSRTSYVIQPASIIAGRRYASSSVAMGVTDARSDNKKRSDRSIKAVRKQLDYIDDPWVLGKHIEGLLARDKFDDALTMVELASKKIQTTVSWNHLIDHLLKKQQMKKAMATFNNVRRAVPQLPIGIKKTKTAR